MRLSYLILVSSLLIFQCFAQPAPAPVYDDTVFTTQPKDTGCYQNGQPFVVAITSYKPGTQTIDTTVNNVPFYLRWSDISSVAPGSAYIVNALDTTQTTQTSEYITTIAVNGIATFTLFIENGVAGQNYELMSSDMQDPRLCHEAYSCAFQICGGGSGGFGDPQFIGLQGQNFQVHGRPDTLFNLISYPSHGLAVNSEFVYLSQGKCNYNNTVCWSHPGTYFGKMGLLLENSTRILVNSGSHKQGLQVYINDKRVKPSDNVISFGSGLIHVEDYDRVTIRNLDFSITLTNSDMFLNMDIALLDKNLLEQGKSKSQSSFNSDLSGLLGQTWKLKDYVSSIGVKRPYKGTTDDYIVETPFDYIH